MDNIETVEKLVDIIKRQADIIRELHNCLAQHDAVTALDKQIKVLQEETDGLL